MYPLQDYSVNSVKVSFILGFTRYH